jgi:hypothetical protein
MSAASLRALMTLRAVVRRRLTVGILVAMPIAFYIVTHDSVGRSVRSLAFGISWAVSTVAFFAAVSAKGVDPRLRLAGWHSRELVAGRVLGLCGAVLLMTAAFATLVALDQPVRSVSAVITTFAATGVVAVAVGTVVGSLITREMEGTLVLFFLAGLQAIANPFDTWSRALPFWSSRELGTWAIDGPDVGSLPYGIAHALVVIAVCASATALMSARRHSRDAGEPQEVAQ